MAKFRAMMGLPVGHRGDVPLKANGFGIEGMHIDVVGALGAH